MYICMSSYVHVRESVVAGIKMHVGLDMELDGIARLRSLFLRVHNRSLWRERCSYYRGFSIGRVCLQRESSVTSLRFNRQSCIRDK